MPRILALIEMWVSLLSRCDSLHGVLSKDQAVRLAQEVPGFAVVSVSARAPVSLGTNPQGLAPHDLAHG